jgi:FK506-binding protein 2
MRFAILSQCIIALVLGAVAGTIESDDTKLKIKTIREPNQPELCRASNRVQMHDTIEIKQRGWRVDTNKKIDTSGEQPMKISKLGSGNLLKGMERGILGMCVGEIISVEIPPELAFYEPGKAFPKRPVESNVNVRYEIELLRISPRDNTAEWFFEAAGKFVMNPQLMAVLVGFVLIGVVLVLFTRGKNKPSHLRKRSEDRVKTGGHSLRVGTNRPRRGGRSKHED